MNKKTNKNNKNTSRGAKKKNASYMATSVQKTVPKSNSNRFIIIFISVFVAAILAAGVIFGVILGVKNARALVKYDGLTLTKSEISFFSSYYKNQHMSALAKSGVAVEDTEEFWNTLSVSNYANTYGEILEYNTREYLKQIIVSNYVFDTYAKLSANDEAKIKKAVSEILDYHASGSIDVFNSSTEKFGFSYSDIYNVTEMLYKAYLARKIIFGNNGEAIAYEIELCEAYLAEYSHVKLLFIRTETDFKLDENGNRVTEDNQDVLIELNEEEKAKRRLDIETIRAAIQGISDSSEIQMSPTMFDTYLKTYSSGYNDKDTNGFYFHKDSEYTAEFASVMKSVVDAALAGEINSYSEVKTDFGVCFIYKYAVEPGAYAESSETSCFNDFYYNASCKAYDNIVAELSKDVVFTEKFEEIDIISIPNNGVFYPRF